MMLAHDSSRRAKKARPLVVGERCYVLEPNNKWIDAFVTGITDNARSYETEVEATWGHLTRNRSHIRPRSPDIPMIHASFLQHNPVASGDMNGNAPSNRESLVISGPKQLAKSSSKTVLSEQRKESIKQSNASQVLVSETVPDRRVQPSRQAKKTRFEDNPVTSTVRVPPRRQPGCDTSTRNRRKFKLEVSDPDLLIPIKQTRVSKRHSTDLGEPQHHPVTLSLPVRNLCLRPPLVSLQCLCPVPHLAALAVRAPVQMAWTVQHPCLRHHPKAAHSHHQMLEAQRPLHQPVRHKLRHLNS